MATHHDNNEVSDLERQMQGSHADQPSPRTTTTTATNADGDPLSPREERIIDVITCSIVFVFILLASPLAIIYVIVSICINGYLKDPDKLFSWKKDDENPPSAQPRSKSVYRKMLEFEPTKKKIQRLNLMATTRAGFLALVWLVVNLCVSSLKIATLFEYPVWKWSLLCVVLLLGYPTAMLVTNVILAMIAAFNDEFLKRAGTFDYLFDRLVDSLTSLVYFMAILLMWLFYFRTNHGQKPSNRVDKYCTWTFVSLFVGSILWVLKGVMLSEWKANAVYKRFKGRILEAGFQLYFVFVITDGIRSPWLLPWRHDTKMTNILDETTKDMSRNRRFQDYILSKDMKPVTVYNLNSIARCMTDLALVTRREDDGISDIVAKYEARIVTHHEGVAHYITSEILENIFGLRKDDAQLLLQELKRDQISDEITYDAFKKWVVDAHKNCLSFGYTLIDAFAVIKVLNRIISGFIYIAVILIWLLITGLATTKVLVLIASPFIAFSFIVGDTCKTFFQGIIFSFVTHPYDVCDQCIIDGLELEVKCIGILTTTFVKIGSKEEVIYPNTSLATKVIINLKGELDPSDTVELILDSSTTKSMILCLKKDLVSFFESNNQRGIYEKTIHVTVKEMGSSIKFSIGFTHVLQLEDLGHSQCFQKKNRQRSELLIDIRQILEDRDINLAKS